MIERETEEKISEVQHFLSEFQTNLYLYPEIEKDQVLVTKIEIFLQQYLEYGTHFLAMLKILKSLRGNLFLMAQPQDNKFKETHLDNLYLYKQEENFFYFFNNTIQYIDFQNTPQIAHNFNDILDADKFNQSGENILKHTRPDVCTLFFSFASEKGHMQLNREYLFKAENLIGLMENPQHMLEVAVALQKLRDAEYLTQDNFILLTQKFPHCSNQIIIGFSDLMDGELLMDYKNLPFEYPESADSLIAGLKCLKKEKMLDKHEQDLKHHPHHAHSLAKVFVKVKEYGLLEQYKNIFLNNSEYAERLANGLIDLIENNIFDEYKQLLINCPRHAQRIGSGFNSLKECGLFEEYKQLLIDNPFDADTLGEAINYFKENQEFLEEFKIFWRKNPNYAAEHLLAWFTIFQNEWLKRHIKILRENSDVVHCLSAGMNLLYEFGIYDEDYLDLMVKNIEHAEKIACALIKLKLFKLEDQLSLLTINTKDISNIVHKVIIDNYSTYLSKKHLHLLKENPTYLEHFKICISLLRKNKILTKKNFNTLFSYFEFIDEIKDLMEGNLFYFELNEIGFVNIQELFNSIMRNIADRCQKEKIALFFGIKKIENNLFSFFKNPLFDKSLMDEVFCFTPGPRK